MISNYITSFMFQVPGNLPSPEAILALNQKKNNQNYHWYLGHQPPALFILDLFRKSKN